MPDMSAVLKTASFRHSIGEDVPTADWLAEILNQQQLCRALLDRLVALEEERREGERQMESLAEALRPGLEVETVAPFFWYRDSDGNFLERGSDRPLTQQEIEHVTYSPRREARERRSR